MTSTNRKIILPDSYIFSYQTQVRSDDINYGGHLDFARLAAILANVRAIFFKSHAITEIGEDKKGLIVRDFLINLKKECFFNDNLEILMGVDNIKGPRFDLFYLVRKDGSTEVARAVFGIVAIDYNTSKPMPVPEKIIETFNSCSKIMP